MSTPAPSPGSGRSFRASVLALGCALLAVLAQGCGGDADESGVAEALANPAAVVASAGAPAPAGKGLVLTPDLRKAGVTEADLVPGIPPSDTFHPEKDTPAEPALGGRVIVHLSAEPPNINFQIENSASIRWLHFDVHASLVQFNPATWEYDLDLATHYDVEDQLFLKDAEGRRNVVFGKVEEQGDVYVVTSGSAHNPVERRVIPKADVERLERGTVWTFEMREAVWHDGHPLDADDLVFSMENYKNPNVDCDEHRFLFEKVVSEKVDDRTVRFFRDEQFFGSLSTFSLNFCILPRHLYDLSDPDNPDHDPTADAVRQGTYVNENPHNVQWVGLGPYRVTSWEQGQFIKTARFPDYWSKDPAVTGWFDEIWWRVINDDNAAYQALINDQLDIFYRVKSEDFFGELTQKPEFTSRCYKAFSYVGNLGYTAWNGYKRHLSDVRVRKALAHAFDVKNWIETNYRGYAVWALATTNYFGPAYNHDIEPLAYDPDEAMDLLADAGWYDRDGNGIVDNEGQDLVVEILMPGGNKASEKLLQAMQSAFEVIGVKLDIVAIEWATLIERLNSRDFDGVNMAWVLNDPESDPLPLWHSSEGEFEKRGSNRFGLRDPVIDDLIERGRRELDDTARHAIWHEMYARLYELQPYLYGWAVPRKFAFNKKLRGVKLYKYEPGFRVRDMYYPAGTPGTRPAAGR